jgi:light-regulated signal transduction histidine kinase (bacteriophytochrome)
LEAANQELEAFSYSVSHDLQAPLRHIDGYAQMLSQSLGESTSPDAARYLGVIRQETQQMGRLINDLLSFSRVGRKALEQYDVDMEALVDGVLSDLSTDIEGRDLKITRERLPEACGDPRLLRQVWANLIGNAVKFTKVKPKARISIGSFKQDGETVYYVKDNGVGFDMKYAGSMFGVFQRLHHQDEFEGTGVGLAIVQRVITRHGGRVWAEAAPDEGAAFYFTLGGPDAERPPA